MWGLQRACEVQVATDATGKPSIPVSDEVLAKTAQLLKLQAMGGPAGGLEFDALTRMIEKIDSSFKQ
jgi:hypothetical protein